MYSDTVTLGLPQEYQTFGKKDWRKDQREETTEVLTYGHMCMVTD